MKTPPHFWTSTAYVASPLALASGVAIGLLQVNPIRALGLILWATAINVYISERVRMWLCARDQMRSQVKEAE